MSKERDKTAQRLAGILQQLNAGEMLTIKGLAEEYGVGERTIRRDLQERLASLPLEKTADKGYRLDPSHLGQFKLQDIRRFAQIASVSDLFPKIDQQFFNQLLLDSFEIKGFDYEDIENKRTEFNLINQTIAVRQLLTFNYKRVQAKQDEKERLFTVEPYKLVNKNGVWYLVAVHDNKVKVFSFTCMNFIHAEKDTFKPDSELLQRIVEGDGIYFEGVMDEVVLKIDSKVAVYFKRRALLPNQSLMEELTDGTLLMLCRKVHEQEILPLVRYWLPYIEIVSPDNLKAKLFGQLKQFMDKPVLSQAEQA